ncbi:MAG: hypothetical protein M0006_15235 [Magnetospirillum sp.]|nr:hypothetical protein [Magnetospirillum sp.]
MASISANAAADGPEKQLAPFFFPGSAPELAAVERYAARDLRRAKAAGRPIDVIVAIAGGSTLIVLESVAICERIHGCPMLVFRDIAKPPVLSTMAFENVTIDYRADKTFLILRDNSGTDRECLVSGPGKARCRPMAKKNR